MKNIINSEKLLYGILLLGLALRLINSNQSFWLDEAHQALTAEKSISEIFFQNNADFHPPLSYLLSHFWIQFGTSEIWLRLLPITFGVLTIWILYLIAKKLFDNKVALMSALFLALAPYHIYYSQEFRMYSLVTFFVATSMYYFLKLLDKRNKENSALFIVSSLAIIYTHYLGGIIFIAQLCYLFVNEKKLIKQFLMYYFIIGIGFIPWLPILQQQLIGGTNAENFLPGWSQMLSLKFYTAIPLLLVKFIIGRIDFDNNLIYAGVVAISGLPFFIASLPLVKKLKDKNIQFLLFWFLIPVTLTFVISFKLPMFQPFRLLFVLPAFLILIAYGIAQKKFNQYLITASIGVFIFANLLFNLNKNFWREDWKTAMNDLKNNKSQSSIILTAWPEPFAPMRWYGKDLVMKGLLPKMPAEEEIIDVQLQHFTKLEKVYFINYLSELSDPHQLIKEGIKEKGLKEVSVKNYHGVGFIYEYDK